MRKKEDPQRIYAAALDRFSRFGFKKTTMEDIAQALNMTKGNLYRYAAGKQALYHDMISWALKRWQSRVAQAVERAQGPRKKFTVMCRKAVDYLSEDRELHRVLVNDPSIFPMFPDTDPFEAINSDSVAMIQKILDEGIQKGDFRNVDTPQVSQVIFLIYKVFIIQAYIRGKAPHIQTMLAETVTLMTQGLFLPAENQ